MSKVLLTEQQRRDDRYRNLRRCIGDRLARTMHRHNLKVMATSAELEMGHVTFAKIMDGEDVKLSTTKWLQILDLAGLKLVDRQEDEITKEGRK